MFQFNEAAPWFDRAKANAQARQQAQGQIWGGIGTMGAGLMRGFQGNRSQNQLNDYFNVSPESSLDNPMARTTFSTVPMTTYNSPNTGFINPNYASSLFGNEGYADNLYASEQF
jgi:hypothetical protein